MTTSSGRVYTSPAVLLQHCRWEGSTFELRSEELTVISPLVQPRTLYQSINIRLNEVSICIEAPCRTLILICVIQACMYIESLTFFVFSWNKSWHRSMESINFETFLYAKVRNKDDTSVAEIDRFAFNCAIRPQLVAEQERLRAGENRRILRRQWSSLLIISFRAGICKVSHPTDHCCDPRQRIVLVFLFLLHFLCDSLIASVALYDSLGRALLLDHQYMWQLRRLRPIHLTASLRSDSPGKCASSTIVG